ncbi:LADA_0H18932g1_1 [Lachancea dasiensis]|uniref:LADA_0H18932g1_1 n=1 Tax=Lachancea dasiensis TaxID=1072105 RepID=A0A1G4K678_9SACH|nr:LADA_0H18932g1_1 [Lachancea dasiensis]
MRIKSVRRFGLLSLVEVAVTFIIILPLLKTLSSKNENDFLKSSGTGNGINIIKVANRLQLKDFFLARFFPESDSFKEGPLNDDFTIQHVTGRCETVSCVGCQSGLFNKYPFDPRFSIATCLHYLQKKPEGEIPFNWYDWKDLGHIIDPLMVHDSPKGVFHCEDLYIEETNYEDSQRQATSFGGTVNVPKIELAGSRIANYCINMQRSPLGFEVKRIYPKCQAKALALQSAVFLFSGGVKPSQLLFMLTPGRTVISQANSVGGYDSLWGSPLANMFVAEHSSNAPDIVFDPKIELRELLSRDFSNKSVSGYEYTSEFPIEHFDFDANFEIEKIVANPNSTENEKRYLDSLVYSKGVNSGQSKPYKYFHETVDLLAADDDFQGHMDVRFFSGPIQCKWKRLRILNALIRGWLRFTQTQNIRSWPAHDSLEAYLFTGSQFPWSSTQVVQMSVHDLHLLARNFNQTMVIQSPLEGNGRFFLDVQPFISSRDHVDDHNNVDARFIDVDSGLYIDILGVGFSTNRVNSRRLKNDFGGQQIEAEDIAAFNKQMGLLSDRGGRCLLISDVLPLRLSRYHGLPCWIPHRAITIVKDESHLPSDLYGPKQIRQKHLLLPSLGAWVEMSKLRALLGPRKVLKAHAMTLKELHSVLLPFSNEQSGEHEELLYWVRIQQQFNFRLKELAIESADLDVSRKVQTLEALNEHEINTLSALQDPFMAEKRGREWDAMVLKVDQSVGSKGFANNIMRETLFQVTQSFISHMKAHSERQLGSREPEENDISDVIDTTRLYFLREDNNENPPDIPAVFSSDFLS